MLAIQLPLPVGELVSKRVLVMDFVEGTPLNRLQETMKERGIEPGSPEAKIAGRRILNSLSSAFGEYIYFYSQVMMFTAFFGIVYTNARLRILCV